MKLSFYIENTNNQPENMEIYGALNNLIEQGKIEDGNLFYNNVDFLPVQPKFGMFDGAELWYFTGTVVTTSLPNLVRASSSVNKFKIVHLYDRTQKGVNQVLFSTQHPVIAKTPEDQQEYYRLTGVRANLVEKIEDIVDLGSF